MRMLNIGFGNMVSAGRIVAVIAPDSAPVKRMVQEARDNGHLVDATAGRRTRAVIMLDTGSVVLPAVQPETIANRLQNDKDDWKAQ